MSDGMGNVIPLFGEPVPPPPPLELEAVLTEDLDLALEDVASQIEAARNATDGWDFIERLNRIKSEVAGWLGS